MPRYDIAIIGAGPGGYVAAIRAAQLGMKAAVIEKDRVGGLCLNWGCIPSKALLWNAEVVNLVRRAGDWGISAENVSFDLAKAVDRSRQVVERMVRGVEFLLGKNNVDVIAGQGVLRSPGQIEVLPTGTLIEADNIIIATGARARTLPGLEVDGRVVLTSREALELRERPDSVVIVGGGPVGMEFAYYWRAYGVEVTVLEILPHLLPLEDEDISRQVERAFRAQGIKFITGARVLAVEPHDDTATVRLEAGGKEQEINAERVLVSVGFGGAVEGLGLEALGAATERGFVKVDARLQTTVSNVYAIGDVTGILMLAHVASAQGVDVVERLAGLNPPRLNYAKMPRATYCQPEVASVGLTETQAREVGHGVKVGKFPFRGNGRAVAMGASEGLVKVVSDAETGEVLGIHIVGPQATELLAEATLGLALETTPRELGWTVHAHPTLSEAVKEAALAVTGEAVHFWAE